ncbi:hypothetical protein LCGC14_1164370 [marine sediment metagenome]|uniref:Uncharacterized protein n=1 Tax=marine sediment metagenome TaxID=412755 RepID=A0A0F9LRS0_9ZZZZ
MASGAPDYYSRVDVAIQALSEMVVRPKFGGALMEAGSMEVVANIANPLVAVAGKGMIYGGVLWLDNTSTQANSEAQLWLDGTNLNNLSFLRLRDYGLDNPRSTVVTIKKYDPTNFIYSAGFSYGLTFDAVLSLMYREQHGVTPTVHWRLVYTLL